MVPTLLVEERGEENVAFIGRHYEKKKQVENTRGWTRPPSLIP